MTDPMYTYRWHVETPNEWRIPPGTDTSGVFLNHEYLVLTRYDAKQNQEYLTHEGWVPFENFSTLHMERVPSKVLGATFVLRGV